MPSRGRAKAGPEAGPRSHMVVVADVLNPVIRLKKEEGKGVGGLTDLNGEL